MDARSLFVFAAAAALASAQTSLVVPGSHQAVDGTASSNVPFGRSTAVRLQSIYDPMLLPRAVTITALQFRLDGDQTAASKLVDCEIRMSTCPLALVDFAADFASNRGTDEVVVLPRQNLQLAAQTTVASPSPFLAPIALAVPFHYDPANGPLAIEVVVFGQPPGAYSLDVTFACDSPEVAIGPAACAPSQGLSLRVESATTQVMWGRPWLARTLDAPPGSLCVLGLGSTDTGNWNGGPLPLPLTSLGAPGCVVAIDVSSTWFAVAQADGTATFAFNVPNLPALIGYWVHFQGGVFHSQLNALGFVTSQAKKVQVCGFEPVGRLWSNGTTATVGSREIGTAPVLRLSIQ